MEAFIFVACLLCSPSVIKCQSTPESYIISPDVSKVATDTSITTTAETSLTATSSTESTTSATATTSLKKSINTIFTSTERNSLKVTTDIEKITNTTISENITNDTNEVSVERAVITTTTATTKAYIPEHLDNNNNDDNVTNITSPRSTEDVSEEKNTANISQEVNATIAITIASTESTNRTSISSATTSNIKSTVEETTAPDSTIFVTLTTSASPSASRTTSANTSEVKNNVETKDSLTQILYIVIPSVVVLIFLVLWTFMIISCCRKDRRSTRSRKINQEYEDCDKELYTTEQVYANLRYNRDLQPLCQEQKLLTKMETEEDPHLYSNVDLEASDSGCYVSPEGLLYVTIAHELGKNKKKNTGKQIPEKKTSDKKKQDKKKKDKKKETEDKVLYASVDFEKTGKIILKGKKKSKKGTKSTKQKYK